MKILFAFMFSSFFSLAFVSSESLLPLQMEEGINFKLITLAEAKARAKKNKQYIFIDAYASWCGPCKIMAATAFKNPEVGRLYNEKFINLKIDVERDNDGKEIAKAYKIRAYPTLLIIDSEGRLMKSILGMQSEQGLIAFANTVD